MFLVFCKKITPRLDYIFKHIFEVSLGIPIDFTTKIDSFIAHVGPKMTYGAAPLGNEFFIQANPLLFEQGIQQQNIEVKPWGDTVSFFEVEKHSTFSFDLFAASFYLLSRYEEYLPHLGNEMGHFTSSASLAGANNFLEIPVVDFWTAALLEALQQQFPELKQQANHLPKEIILIEVDRPYKYMHKSFFRNVFQWFESLIKLDLWELIEQPLTLLHLRKDPWNNFEEIITLLRDKKIQIEFFFLYARISYLDRGISINNKSFQKIIKEVADYFRVNLLASHEAGDQISVLKEERFNLSTLIHKEVQQARYLGGVRSVNEAYRNLVSQEIKCDFSLLYPDRIGYRASTSVPFQYYDLSNEVKTTLSIYPVVGQISSIGLDTAHKNFKKLQELKDLNPLVNSVQCLCVQHQIFEKNTIYNEVNSYFLSYLNKI